MPSVASSRQMLLCTDHTIIHDDNSQTVLCILYEGNYGNAQTIHQPAKVENSGAGMESTVAPCNLDFGVSESDFGVDCVECWGVGEGWEGSNFRQLLLLQGREKTEQLPVVRIQPSSIIIITSYTKEE